MLLCIKGVRMIKKDLIENKEFLALITNNQGDYFSITNNKTSYQGYTITLKDSMYKLIDSINFHEDATSIEIQNNKMILNKLTYKKIIELTNILTIKLNNYFGEIDFDFDFRFLYKKPIFGRYYNIYEKNKIIFIEYEINSEEKEKYFLAIKSSNTTTFKKQEKWIKKSYEIDKKRGYNPDFYIFRGLKIKFNGTGEIKISHGSNEKECLEKFKIKNQNIKSNLIQHHIKFKQEFINAWAGLNKNLQQIKINSHNNIKNIYAGWPWFFQFWTRDTLISLKAFIINNQHLFVKNTLNTYLKRFNKKGLLPSRIPFSELKSIDSTGWFFKRTYDLLYDLINKNKLKNFYSKQELKTYKEKLEIIADSFFNYNSKKGLIYSGPKETWMDTEQANRKGFCIEIQFLGLMIIKTIKLLNLITNTITAKRYIVKETELITNIRKKFFKNNKLIDGLTTEFKYLYPETRPNIFLAYYIYPHVFKQNEWEKIFDNALNKLWLEWTEKRGGLASVDITSKVFVNEHTGHNNKSYHNGDSWYFINNIAGLSMIKLNHKKYKHKINKILNSSLYDLNNGLIESCSEISSAKTQTAEGCLNQSWSCATLIELLNELEHSTD